VGFCVLVFLVPRFVCGGHEVFSVGVVIWQWILAMDKFL
jgi:hypothetical protein